MNFVSPRKMDRIRGFDYIYSDVRSGITNIWYFAELFDISADLVSSMSFYDKQVKSLKELSFFRNIPDSGLKATWLKDNPKSVDEVSAEFGQ